MLLVQGSRMEWRPLISMLVPKALTLTGLCALPRHTSLMITHPALSRCVNGTLWGPLQCFLTLCTWIKSCQKRGRMDTSGSRAGILSARHMGWEWCLATFGDGISDLSSDGMSHSINVGKEIWVLPSENSPMKLLAHHPTVSTTPEHVLRAYLDPAPLLLKCSKNSVLPNDQLLCSSRTV